MNKKYYYSQIGQDYFVDHILDKDNGFFVDIGAGVGHLDARQVPAGLMSNTLMLESQRGWKGIAIDYDEVYIEEAKKSRVCDMVCADLMETNINDILENHNTPSEVDYLSFDVDGAQSKVFGELDFSKYSFKIITYEHDIYRNEKKEFDEEYSGRFEELGYKMLFVNVGVTRGEAVEDWYVNQDLFEKYKDLKQDNVYVWEGLACLPV